MRTIQKSETVASLFGALAKAQSQIGVASKDKVNPAFNSRYVDLSAVLTAVLPAWNANGLAVSQFPFVSDGNEWIELTTLVSHASGEFLEHSMRMPVGGKRDAHAVGSATTYARRYSVASIAGVIQDDDDGNLASHVDIARVEARNVARSEMPRPAPLQAAPAPAQAPVVVFKPKGGQSVTDPEPAAPAAAPAPVQAPVETEPEPAVVGESLNAHQLEFAVITRSKKELNLALFAEWAEANGKGAPTEWPLSKQKQALSWLEKGGWQAIRRWQAETEMQRQRRKEVAADVEARVDAERVEAEVNESEAAQLDAKPKRKRRTKAEMEAYRTALAAGNIESDGGEE
ncbi:MAG: ERF family protein [Thermoanaerobaculales bacterium]|nr:ERF family protein [Thermoanaerobaculales bacterium]